MSRRPLRLTKSDIRFLRWLSDFPSWTTIGKVSPTIEKLRRYGLIEQDGDQVVMTGVGWHALIASGFEPETLDGLTLAELTKEKTP